MRRGDANPTAGCGPLLLAMLVTLALVTTALSWGQGTGYYCYFGYGERML